MFRSRLSLFASLSCRSQTVLSPLPLALPLLSVRLEPVSVAELERRVTGSAKAAERSSIAMAASIVIVVAFMLLV